MPAKKNAPLTQIGATLMACALLAPAFAQTDYFFGQYDSGLYSAYDRHFKGVLFPEVYKNLTSAKVAYPGLWTTDKSSASVGFIPSESGGLGWNALYAQADIDISPGTAGLWAGNFNKGSTFWIFEYNGDVVSWDINEFSLRGAFWISPFQNEVFRGMSAAFDVDNFYAGNGNDFGSVYDNKQYYLNINTLVRLNDNYQLKAAFYTCNKHSENPTDDRTSNRRLFTDALSVGLIDAKLRTLELQARNTFAMNNADEKSDTVSLGLRYSLGGAKSYMKHILFVGIVADAGVSYLSRINQDAGSFLYFHYLQNLTGEGMGLRASAYAPIVADIDLARGLRCMLSITPKIRYSRTAPLWDPQDSDLYRYPQHDFAVELPDAALSLRGRIGEKLDFIVSPSIKSDVFFSVLEARYRF